VVAVVVIEQCLVQVEMDKVDLVVVQLVADMHLVQDQTDLQVVQVSSS
jgi:hypothetical protein